MRLLDRYIVRQVFSHALLGLAVFTFVLFVPQLVRLMELLVRHSGSGGSIGLLFLCAFPSVFTFTLPMGVLVGVLIGLGRMSADSELIALHSLGIGIRRILLPVLALALGGAALTSAMTLWLGPLALRTFRHIEANLLASQASFQIQPRVFDERFPKLVLYVHDVEAGGTKWHGVFLANANSEGGSRLTLAEDAIVIADREHGKLQFHLRGGSTHEYSQSESSRYAVTAFGESDWPVEVSGFPAAESRQPTNQERGLLELAAERGPGWREARVEIHRRLAFPVACLVFAFLGVPLGARPRRGGRAAGFLIALLLIAGYYLISIMGAGMAREGRMSPAGGIWAANALIGLLGLFLLPRIEQIHGEAWISRRVQALREWWHRRRANSAAPSAAGANGEGRTALGSSFGPFGFRHSAGFPQLLDLYLLRNFFYYFGLLLAVFVFLFEAFTFFELLDDIARHRVPFLIVADYFRYLMPHLAYQIAPLAALVGVLVTLGVMAKNNEIVAIKASGISLYRLALPLLVAGMALAGAMLLLDDTFLPYANQRQDALRNQIKGKPPQTYRHPTRQWIFGEGSKMYNYELFDPAHNLFGGLSVFELDPASFQVRRRIYASRAHWEESQKTWILESGWVRDFEGREVTRYLPFIVHALPELDEPPGYFNREVRQAYQLNWSELRSYILDLQQAGFDVASLKVQWHKKLAYPLIAPVIMLLAIPFAFLVGTRGAIGGVAMGVAIGIVYWATSALFEALGGVGQLPPLLSGWAPDLIFYFLGLYFFLKMPT